MKNRKNIIFSRGFKTKDGEQKYTTTVIGTAFVNNAKDKEGNSFEYTDLIFDFFPADLNQGKIRIVNIKPKTDQQQQ